MTPFRILAATLALLFGLQAMPAMAQAQAQTQGSGDPVYSIQNPPAFAMMGDLLIARPFLIIATVAGAGLFLVSLPFTALGGGIGDAGKALVVDPAKAAFVRCLGCTGEGFTKGD
ncbi:multidrug transporter [Pseudomonas sp. DWP3-1-2]|jgi:hypothetical protein|uniref:multidrug transporter n=1 Tax=Pseudomonas sp. DWP3-1-2 TaxID=2804645 RepID=UPI003CFB8969